ncbi:hypothetical protein HZU73_01494 [Apis mellifera caucasica]|nr:hypothetical protein HZU73_01494 [Apis mellifera caucasica]
MIMITTKYPEIFFPERRELVVGREIKLGYKRFVHLSTGVFGFSRLIRSNKAETLHSLKWDIRIRFNGLTIINGEDGIISVLCVTNRVCRLPILESGVRIACNKQFEVMCTA